MSRSKPNGRQTAEQKVNPNPSRRARGLLRPNRGSAEKARKFMGHAMNEQESGHPLWLLGHMLLLIANGGSFSLTVAADGMLLTGTAIGIVEYATAMAESLSAKGSPGTDHIVQGIRGGLAASSETPASPLPSVPSALFMRDVTVIVGGERCFFSFWNGRFDAITGWHLITLNLT